MDSRPLTNVEPPITPDPVREYSSDENSLEHEIVLDLSTSSKSNIQVFMQDEEIEEWIAFSQVLLKDMGTYNKLAKMALQHLHIIRSRTRLVFTMAWEKDTAAMSPEPSLQHIARATRILSQLQPCLGDLLGHRLVLDGFWSAMRAGVFTSNFPSLESLSGPSDPEALEWFLDNCCTIHLRFPSVCTE